MKKLIVVALTLALALSVTPAMAFQALGTVERAAPTPMTDAQLASIEGAGCFICANVAVVRQANVCVLCGGALIGAGVVRQRNTAIVVQQIN